MSDIRCARKSRDYMPDVITNQTKSQPIKDPWPEERDGSSVTDKLQPRPTRRQFYNAQTRCSDRCRGQVTPQANTLTRVIGLLCKTWPSGSQTARVLAKLVEQRQAYILGVTKLTCSSDTWRSPSLRGLHTQYTRVSVFVCAFVLYNWTFVDFLQLQFQ